MLAGAHLPPGEAARNFQTGFVIDQCEGCGRTMKSSIEGSRVNFPVVDDPPRQRGNHSAVRSPVLVGHAWMGPDHLCVGLIHASGVLGGKLGGALDRSDICRHHLPDDRVDIVNLEFTDGDDAAAVSEGRIRSQQHEQVRKVGNSDTEKCSGVLGAHCSCNVRPDRPRMSMAYRNRRASKPVHSTTMSTSATVPSPARTPGGSSATTGDVTSLTFGPLRAENQPLCSNIRLPNGGQSGSAAAWRSGQSAS